MIDSLISLFLYFAIFLLIFIFYNIFFNKVSEAQHQQSDNKNIDSDDYSNEVKESLEEERNRQAEQQKQREEYRKQQEDYQKRQSEKRKREEDAKEDYYSKVLGLKGKVAKADIKKAYRELISQYHPDKVQHLGVELQTLANKKTKDIIEAYEYFRTKYNL